MHIPISKNWFGPEELAAVQQPLIDGWVVQGRHVRGFESAFSQYTCSPHALSCTSGTAALHIAVLAMGLKPGDEVLVPGFTWIATANVVELCGATPVFCDISLDTFNLDCTRLEAKTGPRTVGIIPVHLFGLCAEMDAVMQFAASRGLWVIEDAACALGSWISGRHAGTIGNIGCFSFHPRKSITTGEGGMLVMRDKHLLRHCDGLRNHGAIPAADVETGNTGHSALLPSYAIAGLNYRLTDIQGALGAAQMRRLDFLLAERKRCAEFYTRNLSDVKWLRLPRQTEDTVHAWQSYVTLFAPEEPTLANVDDLHRQRNQLMQLLQSTGIATRQGTHAPPLLDYYAAKYAIRPDHVPNSWIADRLSLALPLYPGMTSDELNYVVTQIRSIEAEYTL